MILKNTQRICAPLSRHPRPILLSHISLLRTYSTDTSISTSSSPVSPQRNNTINPPLSTLPPPITLPTRDSSTALWKHLYQTGKTVLTFYKTGLKAVVTNLQLAIAQRKHQDASSSGPKTRADFQLQRRAFADVKRIPPFALLLLICGEFTPLVVMFVPSIVPATCQMPRQIRGQREKVEGKRAVSFRELDTELPERHVELQRLRRKELLHVATSLGLVSGPWKVRLGLPPDWVLKRRVGKWLGYLETDDGLVEEGGGVGEMSVEETKIALAERGVNVLKLGDGDAKRLLSGWMKGTKIEGRLRMLLKRPRAWESLSKEK
ncbi:MAG: hypothetical protein M1814_001273 [Vezdaea aestivalis]|nr:MAG: hypothetical protein M1814_001273 [Vezdaea aestivalis]